MTQYFVSSTTGALLRRIGGTDAAFVKGEWIPTETVMQYMIGEENNVEPVTEAEARKVAPAAF